MKESLRESVNKSLQLAGIGLIVCCIWQLLETIFEGQINPSIVDSIIGCILMWSLYGNLKTWNK